MYWPWWRLVGWESQSLYHGPGKDDWGKVSEQASYNISIQSAFTSHRAAPHDDDGGAVLNWTHLRDALGDVAFKIPPGAEADLVLPYIDRDKDECKFNEFVRITVVLLLRFGGFSSCIRWNLAANGEMNTSKQRQKFSIAGTPRSSLDRFGMINRLEHANILEHFIRLVALTEAAFVANPLFLGTYCHFWYVARDFSRYAIYSICERMACAGVRFDQRRHLSSSASNVELAESFSSSLPSFKK